MSCIERIYGSIDLPVLVVEVGPFDVAQVVVTLVGLPHAVEQVGTAVVLFGRIFCAVVLQREGAHLRLVGQIRGSLERDGLYLHRERQVGVRRRRESDLGLLVRVDEVGRNHVEDDLRSRFRCLAHPCAVGDRVGPVVDVRGDLHGVLFAAFYRYGLFARSGQFGEVERTYLDGLFEDGVGGRREGDLGRDVRVELHRRIEVEDEFLLRFRSLLEPCAVGERIDPVLDVSRDLEGQLLALLHQDGLCRRDIHFGYVGGLRYGNALDRAVGRSELQRRGALGTRYVAVDTEFERRFAASVLGRNFEPGIGNGEGPVRIRVHHEVDDACVRRKLDRFGNAYVGRLVVLACRDAERCDGQQKHFEGFHSVSGVFLFVVNFFCRSAMIFARRS